MSGDKRRIDVMVSSTTNDLGAFRQRLSPIITNLLLTPRMMDNDSATGKDGLTYSLDLVDEAEIYILLLGYRYGHVPDDPRNPGKLSMTHLEYRRAKERQKSDGICVLAFLLDESLKPEVVRPELTAFREEVGLDQVKFFKTADELALLVQQALANSPCRDAEHSRRVERDFVPREGEVLDGRYTFERRLGQGGNGEVWKVRERLADGKSVEEVAIKLLKRDVSANPQRIERFKHEISTARRLKHPHIIRTTNWGEVGGQFYAVMDYLEGQTLRDFISERAFSDQETAQYLRQVAEALDYAHKMGIVHRDVKPENILVQNDALYLGDFGLAISPEEDMSLTESGELVGTKKYMAPEQWDNQPVTPQTDLYALAIIAYEMLTATFPYDASSHARLLTQHLNQELPPHDRLPDEVLRILRRGAAKNAAERYATGRAFVADLRNWGVDPANVVPHISEYLEYLTNDIHDRVMERFIELSGDETLLPSVFASKRRRKHYMDDDDDVFTPKAADIYADHVDAEGTGKTFVENVRTRLMGLDRAVLIGEPGSGKTFMLQRLTVDYAQRWRQAPDSRIPVLVYLNEYADGSFADLVKAGLDTLAPYHDRLLREGRLVILCDALNEMPRGAGQMGGLLAYLKNAPHFVVSCRVRDYRDDLNDLKPLEQVLLRNLELPAIRDLIHKRLPDEMGTKLWREMGGTDHLHSFWEKVGNKGESERFWDTKEGVPIYTQVEEDQAWRAMHGGARLIPLCRNPYMGDLLCRTYWQDGSLPGSRAELFGKFVKQMLKREAKAAERRGETFPSDGDIENALVALARALQDAKQTVIAGGDAAKRIAYSNMGVLLKAATDANILAAEGDNLKFAHQLLQEYFAARILLEALEADQTAGSFFEPVWWDAGVWRETTVILGEFLGDGARGANRVARWIAPVSPETALQVITRSNAGLMLNDVETETREALAESAQQKSLESDPRGRAAAYRVLGLFGEDNRPGIGLRADGLPEIAWCDIPMPPGGVFVMGEADQVNPRREVELTYGFKMAKCPVTYEQFQAFVNSDEYEKATWWRDFPAEYQARPMREQYNRYANHPRDNVSWYQAVAFTRWLTVQYRMAGLLGAEAEIRLPTEAEWEYAARSTEERRYPYGDEFVAEKGNTSETGIGQSSAVGIFLEGASPFGVLDMSGNLFEWCLNDFSNPEIVDGYSSGESKVLRGGSFFNDLRYAAASARDFYAPLIGGSRSGFRLVLAPPISAL